VARALRYRICFGLGGLVVRSIGGGLLPLWSFSRVRARSQLRDLDKGYDGLGLHVSALDLSASGGNVRGTIYLPCNFRTKTRTSWTSESVSC
jgi:hypothetical protein